MTTHLHGDIGPTLHWNIETVDTGQGPQEYRFPMVHIADGAHWKAHHSVGSTTDAIDGHIGRRTLDILFVDSPDTDAVRPDELGELRESAHTVWADGSVHLARLWEQEVPHLVIPAQRFDEDSLLEAFRRFDFRELRRQ